jgi:hypothetical protein
MWISLGAVYQVDLSVAFLLTDGAFWAKTGLASKHMPVSVTTVATADKLTNLFIDRNLTP